MFKLIFTFAWWAICLLVIASLAPVVLFGGGFALAVIAGLFMVYVLFAWVL